MTPYTNPPSGPKERPILFSAPMVRALLDGTKTQTRRLCKVAKQHDDGEDYRDTDGWPLFDASADGCGDVRIACPYGQSGDRLWVRETWQPDPPIDDSWASTQWGGCGRTISGVPERFQHPAFCLYRASWLHGKIVWRPGIHMPRWASRITLEVTAVRVERLQDITEADAIAEGCITEEAVSDYDGRTIKVPAEIPHASGIGFQGWDTATDWYADLWESINGHDSWDANPWVWVVEFKALTSHA